MTEPLDTDKILEQRIVLLGADKVFYPPALMALFEFVRALKGRRVKTVFKKPEEQTIL